MNFWRKIKLYLNIFLRDNEKRRITILNELKRDDPTINENTFDTYLNYLFQAGYLYKSGYGIYGLFKEIPVNLSLEDVKNEAYGINAIEIQKLIGRKKYLSTAGIINKRYNDREEFIKEEEFSV